MRRWVDPNPQCCKWVEVTHSDPHCWKRLLPLRSCKSTKQDFFSSVVEIMASREGEVICNVFARWRDALQRLQAMEKVLCNGCLRWPVLCNGVMNRFSAIAGFLPFAIFFFNYSLPMGFGNLRCYILAVD